MPSIELQVPLPLPAALVAPELMNILKAIERRTPPFDRFAISTDLRNLHLPNVGLLSVPISVNVGRSQGLAPMRIDFSFHATDQTALFPTFTGSVRCDANGPATCAVWLVGEYTPPLGYVGEILDRTVLNNVGIQTLTAFLETIAGDAASTVQRYQLEAIRTARFNQ